MQQPPLATNNGLTHLMRWSAAARWCMNIQRATSTERRQRALVLSYVHRPLLLPALTCYRIDLLPACKQAHTDGSVAAYPCDLPPAVIETHLATRDTCSQHDTCRNPRVPIPCPVGWAKSRYTIYRPIQISAIIYTDKIILSGVYRFGAMTSLSRTRF